MARSTCKNCGLTCVLESIDQKPREHKLKVLTVICQRLYNLPFQLSRSGRQAFLNFTPSGPQAICAAILCLKDSISLETQPKYLQPVEPLLTTTLPPQGWIDTSLHGHCLLCAALLGHLTHCKNGCSTIWPLVQTSWGERHYSFILVSSPCLHSQIQQVAVGETHKWVSVPIWLVTLSGEVSTEESTYYKRRFALLCCNGRLPISPKTHKSRRRKLMLGIGRSEFRFYISPNQLCDLQASHLPCLILHSLWNRGGGATWWGHF